MTDFKLGTEVVHHHGKQTEIQAAAHFLSELSDFNKLLSGKDKTVSQNLAHYSFNKLDAELHKPHNGTPAELDSHMHASGVYKIDGKMQLVFTDDLYNKNDKHRNSKEHTQHAYTIDEKTGKISAVFDFAHTKTGEKVLMRHKEHGVPQTSTLERTKSGDTTVLHGKNYTEYHTPDQRIIKTGKGEIAIHNPNGPTEAYVHNEKSGNFDYTAQNANGKFEVHGAPYKSVQVTQEGAITTNRTTGDFSTTTYPDGHRVERDGVEGKGNILRIKDAKGTEIRMEWGGDQNYPDALRFTTQASSQNAGSTFEMARVRAGYTCDDIYKSYDEPSNSYHYWRAHVDKAAGTVDYHLVSNKELDELRIPQTGRYQYE
jgi:hypothetical protein